MNVYGDWRCTSIVFNHITGFESGPCRINPVKSLQYPLSRRCDGPRSYLDAMEKGYVPFPCRISNTDSSVIESSRYTD
jgi:hypothetical protein